MAGCAGGLFLLRSGYSDVQQKQLPSQTARATRPELRSTNLVSLRAKFSSPV